MNVGIPRETFPGERRVALVPEALSPLVDRGIEIRVEAGAGEDAGFADRDYEARGAQIVAARAEVFAADTILQVRTLGANPAAGRADLELLRADQVLIGFAEPLTALEQMRELAACGVSLLAMELLPRITRAQSMDVLSSMATIAGYKAVLLAADRLPRIFPLLMTAAGTLTPARVLVVGAGVAGLQAIATARRLGAVVEAYDLRPAVREQVESLGARFVELDLDAAGAEDAGGYATDQDDDFYRRQQEAMGQVVAAFDVVITTAAVPGKKAPVLISREMVSGMEAGAIIIDLAAERGGNCELTRPGETVVEGGVQIVGPLNLPAAVPHHASQMYAHNISSFLKHLAPEDALMLDSEDEITSATLVLHQGQIVHPLVLENDISAAAAAE